MTRSKKVSLTLVAGLGLAARAQQQGDPCEASTFNPKVCKASIHRGGYCVGGAWVPNQYQQSYPYYYDLYQQYIAGGGGVSTVPDCPPALRRYSHATFGGFGHIGIAHAAHS